jgi:radical SAM protein with 4Fe4S-binding SPASM domain
MRVKAEITPTVSKNRIVLQDNIPLNTPLVIYTEPSGYCNFKCSFCPQGVEASSLKKDIMTVTTFKKMISDMRKFERPVKLLRICGTGEPLMNKNIIEMIEYSDTQPFERAELVTNGTLLNATLIEYLPRYLDRIVISIEGLCNEDYKRVCKVDVDFPDLVDKIKKLYLHRGDCKIHIKIIDQLVQTDSKKRLFLDTFQDYCDEIYVEKIVPLWYQIDVGNYSGDFRWGGQIIKHHACVQLFKGLQVQADGVVVPCCVDWKRGNVLGDINKDSLYDIWNGEKLKRLQLAHLSGKKDKLNPCKDCQMNDYGEVDNIDCLIKKS